MKTLILIMLALSSSVFAHELTCYTDSSSDPLFQISSADTQGVRQISYFKPWLGTNGEFEDQDLTKCKFSSEEIICHWPKHNFILDLSRAYHRPFSREKYFVGSDTLIAPPGSLTRVLWCIFN